jgi:uncharacterized protein (TIGR02145 family)
MKKNLNVATASGSWCYDDKPANCGKYGRLYNWSAAMALDPSCDSKTCASQIKAKHRGICPSGFHIPTDEEWDTLISFVGGENTAGTKLKSKSGWREAPRNGYGTDDFGFSALPGGFRAFTNGSFDFAEYDGYWWSATEKDAMYANYRLMSRSSDNVYSNLFDRYKWNGLSLRCVKD